MVQIGQLRSADNSWQPSTSGSDTDTSASNDYKLGGDTGSGDPFQQFSGSMFTSAPVDPAPPQKEAVGTPDKPEVTDVDKKYPKDPEDGSVEIVDHQVKPELRKGDKWDHVEFRGSNANLITSIYGNDKIQPNDVVIDKDSLTVPLFKAGDNNKATIGSLKFTGNVGNVHIRDENGKIQKSYTFNEKSKTWQPFMIPPKPLNTDPNFIDT